MKRFNLSLNRAARLLFNLPPRVPTTSSLIELHWLPLKARTEFKICLITFKALKFNQPSYIREPLSFSSHESTSGLQSADDPYCLHQGWPDFWIPRSNLKTEALLQSTILHNIYIYISRIHVTCWLRQHFSFLSRNSKIVWFLGVASGSPRFPDPLSLPRPPLEPSPWRSARVLHKRFLAHTVKTQYFWARIFYIDIPFHYHFLSFNLYPIIINYRANALRNFCVA